MEILTHRDVYVHQGHYSPFINNKFDNLKNRHKSKNINQERRQRQIEWNSQYNAINIINKYKTMTAFYHKLSKYMIFRRALGWDGASYNSKCIIKSKLMTIDIEKFINIHTHPNFIRYRNYEIICLNIQKCNIYDMKYNKLYPSIYTGIFFGETEEGEMHATNHRNIIGIGYERKNNEFITFKQWIDRQHKAHDYAMDEYKIMSDHVSMMKSSYKKINQNDLFGPVIHIASKYPDLPGLIHIDSVQNLLKKLKSINHENMYQIDLTFAEESRRVIKIKNKDNNILLIDDHDNGSYIYKAEYYWTQDGYQIISKLIDDEWWHKYTDRNNVIKKIIKTDDDMNIEILLSNEECILRSRGQQIILSNFIENQLDKINEFYKKINDTSGDYKGVSFKPEYEVIWDDIHHFTPPIIYIKYTDSTFIMNTGGHIEPDRDWKIKYPHKKIYIKKNKPFKFKTFILKNGKFVFDHMKILKKGSDIIITRKLFTPLGFTQFLSYAFEQIVGQKISYPIPLKVFGLNKFLKDCDLRCDLRQIQFVLKYHNSHRIIKIDHVITEEVYEQNDYKKIIYTRDAIYTCLYHSPNGHPEGHDKRITELQVLKNKKITVYSIRTHLAKPVIQQKIDKLVNRFNIKYDFSDDLLECQWLFNEIDYQEPNSFRLRYKDKIHTVEFSDNKIKDTIQYINPFYSSAQKFTTESEHILYTDKFTRIEKRDNNIVKEVRIIDDHGMKIITNDDNNIKMQMMANALAKPFKYHFKKPLNGDFNKEIVNDDETQIDIILYYENKVKYLMFYKNAMTITIKKDDIEKHIIQYGNIQSGKMSETRTEDKTKGTTKIAYQRINDEHYPDVDIEINEENKLKLKTKYRQYIEGGQYGYKAVKSINETPCICKLFIPKEALVASDAKPPEMLKMRTDKAIVVGIWSFATNDNKNKIKYLDMVDVGLSCIHNSDFKYPVGSGIFVSNFDRSLNKACVPGIHFVATQEEAFAFHNIYNLKESQIDGYKNVEIYSIKQAPINEKELIMTLADNQGKLTVIKDSSTIKEEKKEGKSISINEHELEGIEQKGKGIGSLGVVKLNNLDWSDDENALDANFEEEVEDQHKKRK